MGGGTSGKVGLRMAYKGYLKKDAIRNYFPMPNANATIYSSFLCGLLRDKTDS